MPEQWWVLRPGEHHAGPSVLRHGQLVLYVQLQLTRCHYGASSLQVICMASAALCLGAHRVCGGYQQCHSDGLVHIPQVCEHGNAGQGRVNPRTT